MSNQSTAKTDETIAILTSRCRPLMTAFDSDLTLDLQQIANYPDVPFLHWTRKTGTDIAFLWPADHAKWPAAGVQSQYLFGLCDRRELAHKPVESAKYWQANTTETVHYFDGKTLRRITADQALDVAQNYYRQTIRAWSPMKNACVYTHD